MSAGSWFSCAITVDGMHVQCWGRNEYWELGNITSTLINTTSSYDGFASQPVNVEIETNDRLTRIESGFAHTCALNETGSIWCWGYNDYGQLGNSGQTTYIPQSVSLPPNAGTPIDLTSGWGSTCALTDTGSAYCWGDNGEGQLGIGHNRDFPDGALSWAPPTRVNFSTSEAIADISIGDRNGCAILQNSSLYCWGSNQWGVLGQSHTTSSPVDDLGYSDHFSPMYVGLGGLVPVDVEVGNNLACLKVQSGSLHCWGLDSLGRLGLLNSSSSTPYQSVSTPTYVDVLPAGYSVSFFELGQYAHSCAVLTNSSTYCWGNMAILTNSIVDVSPHPRRSR